MEKDGDRRRSRTSIHAGVTLFLFNFLCSFSFDFILILAVIIHTCLYFVYSLVYYNG